ncbi:hypothetical protein PIB30_094415 [Stylosanthes scabra]|uniref:Uncharacterized protein n=1 Tax=Stylosanthes scabra TaxID=79078 RepID=A0ABU6YX99_9FABA|nr:hypothetical protein [Stylosanthes scabra]
MSRLAFPFPNGNKDKQTLSFDPEIEKTLRKLRTQAKFQEHSHEIPFEEALEEKFEDKTGDNMAGNEDNNRGRKLADFQYPLLQAVVAVLCDPRLRSTILSSSHP